MYDAGDRRFMAMDPINRVYKALYKYYGEHFNLFNSMYYLRARYFNQNDVRFISLDPHWYSTNLIYGDKMYIKNELRIPSMDAIIQSFNLYLYCGNDPINRTDPTGLTYGYMTDFAKKAGMSVTWNECTRTATVTRESGDAYNYVVKNGKVYLNDNEVGYIYRDKIYLDDLMFYRDTGGYDNTAISPVYYIDLRGKIYTDKILAVEAEQRDKEDTINFAISAAMVSGGIKIVGGNEMANSITQQLGYNGAEALKADFVGKSGSRFNMMYDTKTGEIILQNIKDSAIKIFTGLFRR